MSNKELCLTNFTRRKSTLYYPLSWKIILWWRTHTVGQAGVSCGWHVLCRELLQYFSAQGGTPPIYYNRPTKCSLLLTKLTNLSAEWKVGWFCRLQWICPVNCNFCFTFLKTSNLNLFMNFVFWSKPKKNLLKYYHPSSSQHFICICRSAMPRAKKGQQKVNYERWREYFVGLSSY